MLGNAPLGSLAQVVPQVPSVCDLHGLGCPGGGSLREERCAVTADDLNAGAFVQPGGQAGCFPVGQQVHRSPGFDVDQHGPIEAALARRVLVDADHSRHRRFGIGQGLDHSEHSAAADGHSEDTGHAGAGPTCEREADRGQSRPQPLGPPAVPSGQPGYLLDEGPLFA